MLDTIRRLALRGLGTPILLIVILCMMVVPLPPFALDVLFTFNIALSLVVMMATVYSERPLEFAAFPTVLLVATLLRLALNVASTRIVLLEGHTGTAAAGKVIEAFGSFVIGGNYAVGLVVFSILVIINFVVVTKGAGRISEVSARFTLDAMPGKQMAIDADLNAGLISQDEARIRRQDVTAEADFYGSMDGAGKFVRGDAVAGILILLINILGGLAIGVLQHGLPFSAAVRNYTLLTIGDGLVAQIPSLVLSTAAAIMVTRVSSAQDMGRAILAQLFENPRALWVASAIIGSLGLVPGMPNLAFLGLAGAGASGAWLLGRRRARAEAPEAAPPAPATVEPELRELSWDDVQPVDPLGLEIGYRLIPLVDRAQGGQLMARVKGVRKKASQDLGFLVPAVHIRDNLELRPGAYRITLLGVTVGEAEVLPDRELAIDPGGVHGELRGEPSRDPVFGLDALWIEPALREQAQTLGYTVVDANTVIATHLSQILTDSAHLLLGHQETQQLLDRLALASPKLVEDLVPKALPLGIVTRVLQSLLRERVPIRDMRTIAETLAENAAQGHDPEILAGAVRRRLGRFLVQHIHGGAGALPVVTLDPALDRILHHAVQGGAEGAAAMEPGLAERLRKSLADTAQRQDVAGEPTVLLAADAVRPALARLARQAAASIWVLGYGEIPDECDLRIVATVGREEPLPGARAAA